MGVLNGDRDWMGSRLRSHRDELDRVARRSLQLLHSLPSFAASSAGANPCNRYISPPAPRFLSVGEKCSQPTTTPDPFRTTRHCTKPAAAPPRRRHAPRAPAPGAASSARARGSGARAAAAVVQALAPPGPCARLAHRRASRRRMTPV